MIIPFLDLKAQYSSIKEEIHPKIEEVYENTVFSEGPYVWNFEKNFAKYCVYDHMNVIYILIQEFFRKVI